MALKKAVNGVRYFALAALCITPFFAGPVAAQELPRQPEQAGTQEISTARPQAGAATRGYGVEFFPASALYAPYVGDPRRVDFGLQVLHYTRSTISEASNLRFDLKTGGQFHFLRIHPQGHEELGWQFSLEGGFNSQFDVMNRLDNIGWDGRYGLLVTTAQTQNLSFRFGYLHDSSHVGDEYMQRTGRLRLGYTREELAAGVSWLTDSKVWRFYGEYGRATTMGNAELQRPGRAQLGLEWQAGKPVQGLLRGWYAAADVSTMQERDWKMDVSLQAGYRIDTFGKSWRFGLDWYNGRPPIGEFFQHTESYLGFGLWVDI